MPNTIKVIRKQAFKQSSLKQIKLPLGLKSIGDDAFERCAYLKYVYFPPSLTELRDCCFQECHSLNSQIGIGV